MLTKPIFDLSTEDFIFHDSFRVELSKLIRELIKVGRCSNILEMDRGSCHITRVISYMFDNIVSIGSSIHDNMYSVGSNVTFINGDLGEHDVLYTAAEYAKYDCIWLNNVKNYQYLSDYTNLLSDDGFWVIGMTHSEKKLREKLYNANTSNYTEFIELDSVNGYVLLKK